ncbi:MAG TPA: glycosyltransferase [Chthoniobacterales bacterium]
MVCLDQQRSSPLLRRVLMVIPAIARGGCERQLIATVDGLLRRGYEVEIFAFTRMHGQASFNDEIAKLGVQVRFVSEFPVGTGRESGRPAARALQPYASLLNLNIEALGEALQVAIRNFCPDIVHCWSDLANVVGGLVATNMNVSGIMLSQRNVPHTQELASQPDMFRDAYRQLINSSNLVLVNNSEAGAGQYEEWLDPLPKKIHVLRNGFMPRGIRIRSGRTRRRACRARLGLPLQQPVVGAVMRFAPEKDPDLWIETAAAIAAIRPNVHFILAGYGHSVAELETKIAQLGLARKFVLSGIGIDVGLIYGAMDVFLSTSRFEGVPNVFLEAQAAGVPVVSPRVGGASEGILEGTTGVMVDDRSAESLAEAVVRLLSDSEWRARAAGEGPAFVSRRFGQERMIEETIALYEKAARGEVSGREGSGRPFRRGGALCNTERSVRERLSGHSRA